MGPREHLLTVRVKGSRQEVARELRATIGLPDDWPETPRLIVGPCQMVRAAIEADGLSILLYHTRSAIRGGRDALVLTITPLPHWSSRDRPVVARWISAIFHGLRLDQVWVRAGDKPGWLRAVAELESDFTGRATTPEDVRELHGYGYVSFKNFALGLLGPEGSD